jgi:hypothetical protein
MENLMSPKYVRLITVLLLPAAACAQPRPFTPPRKIVVSELDGGTVETKLSAQISVNKNSSLHRKAYVLDDAESLLSVKGVTITSRYDPTALGSYKLFAGGSAIPKEPISACEIRVILFDVFGDRIETLSLTDVADHNSAFGLENNNWRATESQVGAFLTSVAFVAKVRAASGVVWNFEPTAIQSELAKIRFAIKSEELSATK